MSTRMERAKLKKGNKEFVFRFILKGIDYSTDAGYTPTITIWYFNKTTAAVVKIVDGATASSTYDSTAYDDVGATYIDYTIGSAATATVGDYFGEVNFVFGSLIRDSKTFMWRVEQGSR